MAAPARAALVIGDANVDLVVRLPTSGSLPPGLPSPALTGGGTAANTAVALARLGVPVALVGAVGDDGYGRLVGRDLAAAGVDTTHMVTHREAFTALVLAVIDGEGERTVFGWPRRGAAHTTLAPEQIDEAAIRRAAWVHTTGMCLVEPPSRDAVLGGMALAREAGVPVSLDLNLRAGIVDGALDRDYAATLWAAVAHADYVLGSLRDEIAPLGAADPVGATLERLADSGQTVVARLGAAGATLVSARGSETVPAFEVPVVDTLGAGDVFDAGFIAARLAGRGVREATRWGNAAAALKLGRQGGRGSPTRAELDTLLRDGVARDAARAPSPAGRGAPP
ncbi:MAG TPA: carbohydrate kinase family protein [Thermomicrobiales bacterium]|nr:carbohydrate kinase family protein [Thermomicrobiales bacterium]